MGTIENTDVASVFEGYPPKFRRERLALRRILLKTARSMEGVGKIEETLEWGEPAYLTSKTRSGSTIRIAWKQPEQTRYAMYFHCRTHLVETFREMFPDRFSFEGNRAIVFDENDEVPTEELSLCISAALTDPLTEHSLRS